MTEQVVTMAVPDEGSGLILSTGAAVSFKDEEFDVSDIAERVSEPIPIDSSRFEMLLSESIPGAASVADAIAQGERIVLVYPDGKCWDDLMDRKTPGLEGLKHPVVKADDGGVGGGFVALEKAGLSPEALFDMALRIASFAVGQANMAMIDRNLRGIREGIDEVVARMDLKNLSDLRGFDSTLREYQRSFRHKVERENDRRDIACDIRRIISSITNLYQNEMDIMGTTASRLSQMSVFDTKECDKKIGGFNNALQRCLYAQHLEAFARRLLIDYEGDYTSENASGHYDELLCKCDRYLELSNDALSRISSSVGVDGASDSTLRLVREVYHFVGLFMLPFQIMAEIEMEKRSALGDRASAIRIPSVDSVDAFAASLDERRFLHRESNAIVISKDAIQPLLLKEELRQGV